MHINISSGYIFRTHNPTIPTAIFVKHVGLCLYCQITLMFEIADPKSLVTVTVSASNEVTVIGHGVQRKVILTHNKIIIIKCTVI